MFMKLETLRDEDETSDRLKFLKQQKKLKDQKLGKIEDNFFLDEELEDVKQGIGYEEVRFDEEGVA